jgi:hypothetical protein
VLAVLAGPAVAEHTARHCCQCEGVIKVAIGEQTGVGRDPRSMELQLQATVEKRPQRSPIRFTLRVPHPSHPPPYLTL